MFFYALRHKDIPASASRSVEQNATPMEGKDSTRIAPMAEEKLSQPVLEETDIASETPPSSEKSVEERSPEIEKRPIKSAEQLYRERLSKNLEYQI